jgi:hypothetical protein
VLGFTIYEAFQAWSACDTLRKRNILGRINLKIINLLKTRVIFTADFSAVRFSSSRILDASIQKSNL